MKKEKTSAPTYNMTYSQLEGIQKKFYEKGRSDTIELAIAIPMLVLRDHYGFGRKRLEDFAEKYSDMFDSVNQGYLDISDMIKTLEEETGIQIRIK